MYKYAAWYCIYLKISLNMTPSNLDPTTTVLGQVLKINCALACLDLSGE